MSGLSNLSIGSKGPSLLIPPLDRAQSYRQAVFLVAAMEWLLGDQDVCLPILVYRLKRAIPFDPTIGSRSKFSKGCFPWVSYGMATR
jgi:hypothetical protein